MATLKALADPLRLRVLLHLADTPMTVKQLATLLDVPPTRLYYHVRILEEHDLITVVERRVVAGIEERTYRAVAQSWEASASLDIAMVAGTGVLKALFNMVAAEAEVALADQPGGAVGGLDSALPLLSLNRLALSAAGVADVQSRFEALVEAHGTPAPEPTGDEREYHFFVIAFPRPGR